MGSRLMPLHIERPQMQILVQSKVTNEKAMGALCTAAPHAAKLLPGQSHLKGSYRS